MNSIITLVILIALFFPASVSIAAINPDGPIARRALGEEVLSLIEKKEFQRLDNMAKRLREGKERFPDGFWKLISFYEGIAETDFKNDEEWLKRIGLLEQWEHQYPNSPTAKLSLATVWQAYAWYARGGGFQIKPGGASLFRERLESSRKILDNKKLLRACPQFYLLKLSLAIPTGASREEFERLFNEAISFEPRYHAYYAKGIAYYFERWYGKPNEWVQQLNRFDTTVPRGEGIYARLAYGLLLQEWKSFDEGTVSWNRMKQSLDELPKDSQWVLNMKAAFACRAEDLGMLRPLIDQIGETPYYEAWKGNYDKCRAMVKLPRLTGFNDSMEYRYVKFLSEHGNEWAKRYLKSKIRSNAVGYPHE
jgi:hypothetical protein